MARNGKMKASPKAKTIGGKCSGGAMTMEVRYDKHGKMTDSCGNRIGTIIPPKPYNPDTDKSEAIPLKSKSKKK